MSPIAEAAASPSVWDIILPKLLEAALPLLTVVLGWASVELSKFIRAKTKNEALAGALTRLNDVVFTVVKALNQTVVDELRKANADGKVTKEEVAGIKAKALEQVKSHIGPKGIDELLFVLGLKDEAALDKLVSDKVEAAVGDVKASAGSAAVPT